MGTAEERRIGLVRTERHAQIRLKTQAFTAVVILSNCLGNFSLAWGLKHLGAELRFSPLLFLKTLFSPWVLAGVLLLILWLLSRMALLSWADLTYVLPVTSLGYVLSAMMGRWFLGEHVSWTRWSGTLLIVAGTAIVGLTRPDTTGPVENP
ncbi:MAG: EamA family transporter [Bryobacteraceae bacterium]